MGLIASTYHRLRVRPRGPRRLGALIGGALAAVALATSPAAASTLVIEGEGDGHGVGMSQDGALGYAQHGWSYEAILAHYYTATTIGQAPAGAVVRVLIGNRVVKVGLERYVRGVVSAEMPSSWPMAALEAQAVASRTYALTAHAGGSRFDVYSDTRSQVYLGVAAETARTNAAVSATAGQTVLYAGQPAITYYFASSGGMTENIENSFLGSQPEPWLRGVQDLYESRSAAAWKLTMSFASATSLLRGFVKGAFRGIDVLRRGVSPRIVSAEVLGSRGATLVSGPELEGMLGLNSTWAYFSVKSTAGLLREPDMSARHPSAPPAASSAPATPSSPQGGVPAPIPATAATGGVPAG